MRFCITMQSKLKLSVGFLEFELSFDVTVASSQYVFTSFSWYTIQNKFEESVGAGERIISC